jgi:hypothetical protein
MKSNYYTIVDVFEDGSIHPFSTIDYASYEAAEEERQKLLKLYASICDLRVATISVLSPPNSSFSLINDE